MPIDISALASFPPLEWDKHSWEGRVELASWSRFEPRRRRRRDEPELDPGIPLLVYPPVRSGYKSKPFPPSEAQVAAFRYLLDNGARVTERVLAQALRITPGELERYEQETGLRTPIPRTVDELPGIIRILGVYILGVVRDEIAYVGFEFGCRWDREHGLGVLTHVDRVVEVGQADIAFSDSDAIADGGREEFEHTADGLAGFDEFIREHQERARRRRWEEPLYFAPDPEYLGELGEALGQAAATRAAALARRAATGEDDP